MTRAIRSLTLAFLLLGLGACESRTDRTDGGGVLLTISDFDLLPLQVSVNQAALAGFVQIGDLTIQSVAKDPNGVTSSLMDVELKSFEVTFTRADAGARVPPPFVRAIFSNVPVNGTATIINLDIMGREQLLNTPLSDLLIENGAFDRETGSRVISLNVFIRFFGRTLSGDEVQTAPAGFTLDFVP